MRRLLVAVVFLLSAFSSSVVADEARVVMGLGNQMGPGSPELSARYIAAEPVFGHLHPTVGMSVAGNGSAFVGLGAAITFGKHSEGIFARFTSMVGAHRQGNGRNLGGPLQFRNALDIGYRWASGVEAGLGADHRSNAGLDRPNPGLNTIYLFASIPLD
ncbi:acyloxyacyl hydrolase [Roseibaca sp. Y0-43]|uniref:acyloxyacyl hydrolase n=1 Tax=Roseibaca sp. Y0-43 TaxID=2816854 RepID=UPI001D0CD01E|nr:acyloxyacyl hydrolase [Roseibaca sp. Y0-43]